MTKLIGNRFHGAASCLWVAWFAALSLGLFLAASPALAVVAIPSGSAVVMVLEGDAALIRGGVQSTLAQGTELSVGDQVKTGGQCRMELRLADSSAMRFGPDTHFELQALEFEDKKRNIKTRMFLGKMWAKVAEITGISGGFETVAKNAIGGVRGTTYRMNVGADDAVVLKVYWGEVLVSGKQQAEQEAKAGGAGAGPYALSAPQKVSGPTSVPGPHSVTMEEWSFIVKSMQQISVGPDGSVDRPLSFDPRQDASDWVRWNKEMDRRITNIR